MNIRKIIERRLEKIEYEYELISDGKLKNILSGQIEAYQDCLNLLPPKRTEAEILKNFEALGYEVKCSELFIHICYSGKSMIIISKAHKLYQTALDFDITMQEHKLLNELFEVIFNE